MKLKGITPTIVVKCTAKMTNAGKVENVDFEATFTRLTRTMSAEIRRKIQDAMEETRGLGREYATDETSAERKTEIKNRINELEKMSELMVKDHIQGWKMPGEGGDVPFNEENLNSALEYDPYFSALYDGLFRATGVVREEQRQKN